MSEQRLEIARIALNVDGSSPSVFPPNTHICHFYRNKEDLIDLLVPFFREGLERNEFCLWGVTAPLNVEEATAALGKAVRNVEAYVKNGQLEIFDIGLLYGAGGFDAMAVRDAFLEKVKTSLAKGWTGFRCDGITSGVKPKDWTNFQVYEEEVTRTLPGSVTALCSYNVADLSPLQLANVAETHLASLIKKQKEWYVVGSSNSSFRNRKAA